MRLVTFLSTSNVNRSHLGLWLEGDKILDLTRLGETGMYKDRPDWGSTESLLASGPAALHLTAELAASYLESTAMDPSLIVPAGAAELLAPINRPNKIVCIGLNYRDHCAELGAEIPDHPIIFAKYATAITGPGAPIVKPAATQQLDYEAELGVVIGKPGKNIARTEALSHVAGYLNFNDVSARDIQFGDRQWLRGKTYDTFAPIGPFLVTAEEVPEPGNLAVRCWVNKRLRQDSSTAQMIFDVACLVAFLSQIVPLYPGDIIATGTPAGVGVSRKLFLQPGDVVRVAVEGLGVLENAVVSEPAPVSNP